MFEDNNTQNSPSLLYDSVEPPVKKKPKQVSITVTAIIAVISLLVGIIGAYTISNSGNKELKAITDKLAEVDKLVSQNYLGDLDYNEIDKLVLSSYMYAIGDKYSFYQSGEDAKAVADSFSGDTTGIGITVVYDKDNEGLYITRLDNSGPAQRAGLGRDDIITEIDGKTVKSLGFEKAVAAIQRKPGESVKLTILRGSNTISKNVVYMEFVRQTVYTSLVDDYGYICFTGFNDATVEQFKNSLDHLKSQNVKGLIFDVRDNGGGTVDSVNAILDILLPKCDLMSVEYVDGEKKVAFTSDEAEVDLPSAVLVNENTASAAELFAAAMRDVKKSPLIGATSYGKGVMQSTYFLSDGSCVRFTVGKFYPPSGVCFDSVGLQPDHKITYTETEKENLYKLYNNDPAIIKAVEVIKEAK